MTQIRLSEECDKYSIDIVGHAGFNPGNDIVCASISTLSYTLIQTLLLMSEQGKTEELTISDPPGNHHIEVKVNPNHKTEWLGVINTIMTGLRMVEYNYPEYVKVNIDRSVADDIDVV